MKRIIFLIITCISTPVLGMRSASRQTISKATQSTEQRNSFITNLKKLFASYQHNYPEMTPEKQALYHFQNTQVPSGAYVPIIPIKNFRTTDFGAYNSDLCSIKLFDRWYQSAPTIQYATLLHEYRHRLQHIFGIFDNDNQNENWNRKFYPKKVIKKASLKNASLIFNNETEQSWKIYEFDADYFAASHITCPTCLKICQCQMRTDNASLGYFTPNDIQPFIDQAFNNPTCPAHSLISGDFEHNGIVKKLYKKLNDYQLFPSEFLYDEIINLDKQSGTLLQHIPTFAIDMINSMKEYEDFAQLLAEKTIKELDVAQLLKQAEQDITDGKFKQITAGNEPIINLK